MKKAISIILAFLLLSSLAVSAGACILPFPGADILTVTQDGKPVAGADLDLYRVHLYGGEDTLLGRYTTGPNGTVTAGHLTTGLYYWQDASEVVKAAFRITGAGFVRTAIDIPASISETVAVGDREIVITVDLAGGYAAEINSYGTLYLFDKLGADMQICNGYVLDEAAYLERVEECRAYDSFSEKDGVIRAVTEGEYGSCTILYKVSRDIYYMLVIDADADAADIFSRITVVGPASDLTGDDYLGTWVSGRASMTVEKGEGDEYLVHVIWGSSAWEVSEWEYVCYFDGVSLYSFDLGVKKNVTYGDDGEIASSETEFETGATNLTIGDDGKLTWFDFMTYPEVEPPVFEKTGA